MRLSTVLPLLQLILATAQQNSLQLRKEIDFFDELQGEQATAELQLYVPRPNEAINEHLILIMGGGYVGAEYYSSIADRLASIGYVVAITKYVVMNPANILINGFPLASPFGSKELSCSQSFEANHLAVVGGALQQLMEGSIEELQDVQFEDFVVVGHSLGSAITLQFSAQQPDPALGILFDLMPKEIKTNYWDQYLGGIVAFEGGYVEKEQLQEDVFQLYIASQYYFENLTCIDQVLMDEMNHFSINDFQGQNQIVPCTLPRPEEFGFRTSQQKWDEGLELMTQMIDLEIKARLDGSSEAYDQFVELFENERVLELVLVEDC